MESKELRKKLRSLGKQVFTRYPKINYGGCCVFAAAVATELEKLGVQYEVMTCGSKKTNLNDCRPEKNEMSAWEGKGAYFGHVGVRMKLDGRWWTYDAEALRRHKHRLGKRDAYWSGEDYWEAVSGGLTAQEATELADEGKWNQMFYNPKNVKAVRRIIQRAFA